LRRQRGRLLEQHIALVARARESGALGNDRSIDVGVVDCGAIADLADIGLTAASFAAPTLATKQTLLLTWAANPSLLRARQSL
jgi:hypothetical protein